MLSGTKFIKALGAVAVLVGGVGCEVTPDPIAETQYAQRARSDLTSIRSLEFVPTAPITLDEAMARAVAVNLKRRVSYIERRIAEAELEQSNYEMLPTLELSAGKDRSNVQVSPSDDRITKSANASFTWNILDLGVSYARAKQKADEVLIAREMERKALQDIIRQVNVAFWRAASGQRLMARVKSLAKDLRTAMQASRDMEKSRATDVLTAVAFRRDIVASVRKALAVQRELKEAKAELAELLNIRPGREFELALPAIPAGLANIPLSIPEMERHSLEKRPELRIEDYNERISEWQAREALYDMLPGLDITVAQNYSSETTNISPNWLSTGIQLGMNLFNLFSGSSEIDAAEKRGDLARQQRLAMSVAVLTQVHIAHIKYRDAQQQLKLVSEIANSDRRLSHLVRTEGKFLSTNFLDAVRLATQHLQSEMDEQRAHIDLVSAHADLMHAIGLDAVPETIALDDLAALEGTISAMLASWRMPQRSVVGTARTPQSPMDQLVSSMIGKTAAQNTANTDSGTTAPRAPSPAGAKRATPPNPAPPTARMARQLNSIAPSSGIPLHGTISSPATTLDWEIALGSRGRVPPGTTPPRRPAPRYFVSLGAYLNQGNAVRSLDELTSEAIGGINIADLEIVFRAGDSGKAYYYVQSAALKNRQHASRLCRAVKRSGRDCFIGTR